MAYQAVQVPGRCYIEGRARRPHPRERNSSSAIDQKKSLEEPTCRSRSRWQADPIDNSVLIFLAHNMLELQQMASGIGLDAWSAIAKFHELASA